MKKDHRASIIIPVYNEEEAIGTVLGRLIEKGFHRRYGIIVVNDGSTDRTKEIVEAFKGIRLISHYINRGYGAALKTGIRAAGTEKVILMDSDGQHSPDTIDEIEKKLDDYPLVIGQRDEKSHQVKNRRFGKWLISRVGRYLLGQNLPDYNSGFRGFRTRYIRNILNMMPNSFSFSTTSTLAFIKLGYDIGTVDIHVSPRIGGSSNVKILKDGARTVLLIFRIIMLFNPLKVFIPVSIVVFLAGVFLSVLGISIYHRIPNSALIFMTLSMFLFFFGLIADQVSMLNFMEDRDTFEPDDDET